jgi:hypothetical protein
VYLRVSVDGVQAGDLCRCCRLIRLLDVAQLDHFYKRKYIKTVHAENEAEAARDDAEEAQDDAESDDL